MNTLLLTSDWDLAITPNGDLAIATGNYAIAQDVCAACKTWRGEQWYNTALGVPYLQNIFAKRPTVNTVKTLISTEAMRVPGVATATIYLTAIEPNRNVGGQIQITYTANDITAVIQVPNFGMGPWWISAASRSAVGAIT